MPTQPLNRLVGQVRKTLATHHEDDAGLLARYREGRDPAALDALVRKHAPIVLAACRKVLPDSDADDAFQATFLILMRDARSIRSDRSVGSWLYGVAHRLALQARAGRARRARIEEKARTTNELIPPDLSWREACGAVHEELDRLPDGYRIPLLLCYLEGKTRDEAAAELGWTLNRVRGQLERGRLRLRARLERRGIALSAGLLAAVTGNSVTAGGPPARLIQSALRATAGRPTATARALAHGASPMSLPAKLLVTAVVVSLGIGIGLWQLPAAPTADAHQPPKEIAKAPVPDKELPGPLGIVKVEVTGRVVDPDGKPVAGAKVVYQQDPIQNDSQALYPDPSTGVTEKDGSFRFTATMYGRGPNGHEPIGRLTAMAPGFAAAGTGAGLPKSLLGRTLKLARDDVPLENRFLDLEGKPIAGVTARCVFVIVSPDNDLGPWLKDLKAGKLAGGATTPGMPIPSDLLGTKTTATSDKDGRIKLAGIGRGRVAFVRIDGPGIESRLAWVMTHDHETVQVPQHPRTFSLFADQPVHGCKSDIAVGPGTPVEGVVTDLDTGKPVAGATVYNVLSVPSGLGRQVIENQTDGQGRYQLMGRPTRTPYRVTVTAPKGETYLLTAEYPPAAEPGKTATLDFRVKRGVFIRGKVTDEATGAPLRAAIAYNTWGDNPHLKGIPPAWWVKTTSTADGTYELIGLPGRGLVTARLDEHRRGQYVVGAGAEGIKGYEQKGQSFPTVPERTFPNMVNALAEVDAKADGQTVCDIRVIAGRTVKGRIEGPDGKPVTGTVIHGAIGVDHYGSPIPTAEFSLSAVNPRDPKPYFFYQCEKNLATAVIVKGDELEGFIVKLQPAATVSGRLLDADGEPLANTEISGAFDGNQLGLKGGWYGFFHGKTDWVGRFKIAGLIPGVRLSANVMRNYQVAERIFEGLGFSAGEVRDLGNLKVQPAGD